MSNEEKQWLEIIRDDHMHKAKSCPTCFLLSRITTLETRNRQLVQAMGLLAEIEAEQRHGREKYGNGPEDYAHDDNNSDTVWFSCIEDHNSRALVATPMERRQHLKKVAGLAISAIQSHDRKALAMLKEMGKEGS